MTTALYELHPIRAQLQHLLEMRRLSEFSSDTVTSDASFIFARDKVFSVVQALQDVLISTPAEMSSLAGMSALHSNLGSVVMEMNAFVANLNPAHLQNAASHIEQGVIPFFWAFVPQPQSVAENSFPKILQAQADFSHGAIRELTLARDRLKDDIGELNGVSQALEQRMESLGDIVAKGRAEAAAELARLDQTFTLAEGARQGTFDAAIAEYKTQHEDEVRLHNHLASKTLEDLNRFREEAARIVQVVGNIGVTGNYQNIANAEGKQANFWRWATLGILGTGIFIAVATFIKFWSEPFSNDTAISVLIRLFYAIVITSPAIYTARESARHRTNADRARQTELELASIGPFIELLPEANKIEIRAGLTASYFGRATEAHTAVSPLDPENLKALVEIVKAFQPSKG